MHPVIVAALVSAGAAVGFLGFKCPGVADFGVGAVLSGLALWIGFMPIFGESPRAGERDGPHHRQPHASLFARARSRAPRARARARARACSPRATRTS